MEGSDSNQPYMIDVRQNRRPRDASIAFSALFNLGIERKFGIPNIRKRACFCTTSKRTANSYASYYDEGDVVQLGLPSQARIVFNPQVEDSVELAASMPSNWYDFTMEHATIHVKGTQSMTRADYMSLPPIELFRKFAEAAGLPETVKEEYMGLVLSDADELVKNYDVITPSAFSSPGRDVECMVVDADQIEVTPLNV